MPLQKKRKKSRFFGFSKKRKKRILELWWPCLRMLRCSAGAAAIELEVRPNCEAPCLIFKRKWQCIFIHSMHYAQVCVYVCTYTQGCQDKHSDKVLQTAWYAILFQLLNIYILKQYLINNTGIFHYALIFHKYFENIKKQDNVRTNTESVQCHHVFDTAYVTPALRGHVTSSITWPMDSP